MKQYVCSVCSYTYDEAKGILQAGIAPGTKWEELPEDWKCPLCGAGKSQFREKDILEKKVQQKAADDLEKPYVDQELSAMEMSIICSNLARGCEKQYLPQQEEGFRKLAEFFRSKAEPAQDTGREKLLELIDRDLSRGYPYGMKTALEESDRGALRCQTWSEKVTNMLKSLLTQYEKEGEKMLENTNVYVCTICGFVYVGDTPLEQCPVCKVPSCKFQKVERRA